MKHSVFYCLVLSLLLVSNETMGQGLLKRLFNNFTSSISANNQTSKKNKTEIANSSLQKDEKTVTNQTSKESEDKTTDSSTQKDEKTVTLVTNGSGNSKDEATKNALRSAIEQAYGTFISANTKVLDDELIKDEIVTVSTGNIKTYKELGAINTDGRYEVSVQATVSIDQLTKFAQGKGMQTELAGASFVMNMKMRELNKKNEYIAIQHMIEKAKAIANNGLFDYKLEIGEPRLLSDAKYAIKIRLLICENDNTKAFYNYIYQTLEALRLSEKEVLEYNKIGVPCYVYNKQLKEKLTSNSDRAWFKANNFQYSLYPFYLRNKLPSLNFSYFTNRPEDHVFVLFPLIVENALKYVVQDNLGNQVICEKKYINIDTRQPGQTVWDYASNGSVKHFFAYSYLDKERDMILVYEMLPYNRLLRYDKDYFQGKRPDDWIGVLRGGSIALDMVVWSEGFSFNPLIDNYGRRRTYEANVCFQQEFCLLYSEEELSRLNNITIKRRMD